MTLTDQWEHVILENSRGPQHGTDVECCFPRPGDQGCGQQGNLLLWRALLAFVLYWLFEIAICNIQGGGVLQLCNRPYTCFLGVGDSYNDQPKWCFTQRDHTPLFAHVAVILVRAMSSRIHVANKLAHFGQDRKCMTQGNAWLYRNVCQKNKTHAGPEYITHSPNFKEVTALASVRCRNAQLTNWGW